MADYSSSPPWSETPAAGASKSLINLPNRGLLSSSSVPSTYASGMRVYVCEHDTSPPGNQLIKTNEMNILIRSLVRKKRKVDPSLKDSKCVVTDGSKKRAPERALEGKTPSKRLNIQNNYLPGGSKSHVPEKNLRSLTVERLRAILKEKGLTVRGKKDELIARLRGLNG